MTKKKKTKIKEFKIFIGRVDHVNINYAYVVPNDKSGDIWVKKGNLLGATDKDIVKVAIITQATNTQKATGKVVEIIEKVINFAIGIVYCSDKKTYVSPCTRRLYHEILIEENNFNNTLEGDKVIVKITGWSKKTKCYTGIIEKVLGPHGTNEVEMHAIMEEFGLDENFSDQIVNDANSISLKIKAEEIGRRRDFRDIPTFTIDPEDAKDFDDALSFKKLVNGHYEIGIHIADVTFYVKDGTNIGDEALRRGTSVYLVDRVVPMLPEKLSNELCSLNEKTDKLTFSAVFEIDDYGNIYNEWFGETIINSNKRFTYEEAQKCIDTQNGEFYDALTCLNSIAMQLRMSRFKNGAINFETVEMKFQLDENGKPLKISHKIRYDTNKLVEEFMLLANRKVATKVAEMHKNNNEKFLFVYRTHDSLDNEKLNEFLLFVKLLGYKSEFSLQENSAATVLNSISKAVEGTTEENIVTSMAVRTMARAIYTTEPKSHFGLAFKHYTHFTSPIRRYADILVHRLLKIYLSNKPSIDKSLSTTLEQLCQHISEREHIAASAERASIKYKQVEFVQMLSTKELDGIVAGITDWGIYIELIDNQCEGLVKLTDMKDDYYEVDKKSFCIIGRKNKKKYTLGQKIKVKVKSCDLDKRTVDFILL